MIIKLPGITKILVIIFGKTLYNSVKNYIEK